jgi:DNA-binding CsgD family transcriptional regulator
MNSLPLRKNARHLKKYDEEWRRPARGKCCIMTGVSQTNMPWEPVRRFAPDDLMRIVRHLDACESTEELRDVLMNELRPFGFKGFSIAIDRKMKSLAVHAAILATWPKGTNERYVSSGMFFRDPVVERISRSASPIVWDLSIYDLSKPAHAQIHAVRCSLGVTGGIVVPVMESMGGRTVLFLSGVGFPYCEDTTLYLRVILEHVIAQLNRLRGGSTWTEPQTAFVKEAALSTRERQVLGWIAFGKSSREVATIMGLSEHTVNEHIAGAVDKLDASNRTEAVMRAVMTDDIDLA